MSNLKKINAEHRLYVIGCGDGYSCLGFDVAERRRLAVLAWIGLPAAPVTLGTAEAYAAYTDAMRLGEEHNRRTGARCGCELTPALTGLEGRRVEVTEADGTRRRFTVGKSTGWMPCHLEIATRGDGGGMAVYLADGDTVRTV